MRLLTLIVPGLLALAATDAAAQKGATAPAPQVETPAPTPPPVPAPAPAPQGGGSALNFGDDSGDYPNDGECDDRRFAGPGMATAVLSWQLAGRDASDCRSLAQAGQVRPWNMAQAVGTMQCDAVDFGDDSGDYPNDGECDDMRFEGFGMGAGLGSVNVGRDAGDCSRLCGLGMIGMR